MSAIITRHVLEASAGLQPLLQTIAWEGRIAAVFHRSILCTAPAARLLHLHTGPRLTSPFSLRIEGNFANVLRATPFVQGMRVRKIDLAIAIAEDVHLRLDRTTYYQSPRHLSGAVELEGVRHAHQTLRAYGRAGGFDRLLNAQATITGTKQALADKSSTQMLDAARHVIGLGPGLTPSGDDFLVGCLRGLWLLRTSAPWAYQMLDCLRAALLPDLEARTTRVSAEFIRYGLDGAFAEVLDRAAVSLLAPSLPAVVQSAVSHLLAQGETSGTDTLLGLLTCLEALSSLLDPEPHHEWQACQPLFPHSLPHEGRCIPMPIWNVVRKGVYHDSVTLMRLTRDLELVHGVRRAAVMVGTPPNRALLRDAGLLTPDGDTASPNDLIIAVEADDLAAAQGGAQAAEAALSTSRSLTLTNQMAPHPRTLRSALTRLDGANLALISVPGLHAGVEAMKALRAGLHVMLFSDNVPVSTEVELKLVALARGLLMLGADCGTAIINGVPLGFANAVPRGRVGLAAASGTGLQEISCLVAAAGEGISQAIGVGGRDLTDEVGGLMMAQAVKILAADPATEVIGVLGKPPGPRTWERLQTQLTQLRKPCVVHFPGLVSAADAAWYGAATLEEAALGAVALVQGMRPTPAEFTVSSEEIERSIEDATRPMHPDQRFVRGIYAGGTLACEALSLLQAKLSHVFPGALGGGEGHSVVDVGGDQFTLGRPHPMIDGTLRREWIRKAAEEPSTAVILLDVILGYGAHADPARELLAAIQQATRQAQSAGRHLAVVASVCGTERDPQRRSAQVDALRAGGVIVMPSNAQAARLAAGIAARLARVR